MNINILEKEPLQLYVESEFETESDRIIAEGISALIFQMYEKRHSKIYKVQFNEIKKIVLNSIEGHTYNNGKKYKGNDDFIRFYGFDGKERSSYQEIADERGIKNKQNIENNVKNTCIALSRSFYKEKLEEMLFKPKNPDDSEKASKEEIEALENRVNELENELMNIKITLAKLTQTKLPPDSIDDLEFSNRTYNALIRGKIKTVKQLSECSARQLFQIRNFGKGCLKEVLDKLHEYGLDLKE